MKIVAYTLCYGLILKPDSSSLIWHQNEIFPLVHGTTESLWENTEAVHLNV